MDSLLQNRIAAEMMPDFSAKLLCFPVRHHSPVCSFQLIRTIELYQPEIILVEGPENANDLLPILTDERTESPIAIYYFYKDKKKLVSAEGRDFHCYYPFLESSPELTALREAARRGISARFIDLPYSEILIHTKDLAGLRSAQERHSYADDRRLTGSSYYRKLCDKTQVRSFEEFWEKYFEFMGLHLSPAQFIRQMSVYCQAVRSETPEQQLSDDGTLTRENHMAHRIQELLPFFDRILVVSGGFHTAALSTLSLGKKIKPLRLHSFPPEVECCYPIPYTYEAADVLSGYAAGIPHPGYCDAVTRALRRCDPPEQAYTDTALTFLTQTAHRSMELDSPVSTADITAAWSLTEGLAALRGLPAPGFAEVHDGVTGAYVKGAMSASTALPLEVLRKLATGSGVGHIGDQSHVPPLIEDFEREAKALRLKIDKTGTQETEVSLFTSEREIRKSRFFHRMDFLRTEFCRMYKGPDLHTNTDRSRVREIWHWSRTPQVDGALVDHTTDGLTIAEACRTIAARRIRDERRCEIAAQVSVDCFLMGLTLEEKGIPTMDAIIAGDGDFFSLGRGLHAFDMLRELRSLYGFEDEAILHWLTLCTRKLLSLLPSMASVSSSLAPECIRICRLLYGVTGRVLPEMRDDLYSALLTLTHRPEKEPSLFGAALGLLYASDSRYLSDAQAAMRGYLTGTGEMLKRGASYLRGLFETARDIALNDRCFLQMTDELLSGFEAEDFLEILPSLRLAFSYFTPQEIQTIAEGAAGLHGIGETELTGQIGYDETLHAFGAQLDAEIFQAMRGSPG